MPPSDLTSRRIAHEAGCIFSIRKLINCAIILWIYHATIINMFESTTSMQLSCRHREGIEN